MSEPVLPGYGRSTLADVLPAVAARLGVEGLPSVDGGRRDAYLSLPEASRFVVVLVDGLGYRLLRSHLADAPYLADLFGDAREISTCAPSTTATSITSLGTGVAPGQHGIVGYTFREPTSQLLMNALSWDNGPADARAFQPLPTVYERVCDAGVITAQVTLPRFEGTGLSVSALRGTRFIGRDEGDAKARIAAIRHAAMAGPRTLTYVYERRLDHTGHGKGTVSPAWRRRLSMIDSFLEQLRAELPDDVALLVTGDHGMIDVPINERVVIDDDPALVRGVDLVGGEARFRQLYTSAPDAVASRWRTVLSDRAWVYTRDEAIDAGLFGHVLDDVRPRIGDVLVAMRGSWAALSRTFPEEFALVGMHGSLTPEETQVPLLIDHPASDWWPHG